MGARLTGASAGKPIGAILAGGAASRLGGIAKGLIEIDGKRIIDRIRDALAPVVESVVLVANSPHAADWLPGSAVIGDVLDGGASAAGIHAALTALKRPVIAVAWDMPFVTTALFQLLARHAADPETDVVVPAGGRAGRIEPLCAWYAPSCADAIERAWRAGERSLHVILRGVRAVVVPPEELAAIGVAEKMFLNVNSPADVARATQLADDGAASGA